MIQKVKALTITELKDTRLVTVVCPHCGKKHTHGWPYTDDDVGHRSSHCAGLTGYEVIA